MFNNPYLYQNIARPGLLARLFGGARAASGIGTAARSGINWGTLLNNAQKSLGIINQAIPIVYQVKPMINNAKTMFKIAGAVKDSPSNNYSSSNSSSSLNTDNTSTYTTINENKPIFYI